MGDFEVWSSGWAESLVKYHPLLLMYLTVAMNLVIGQCQVGSLTGAVASKKVTEAPKGSLRVNGNHPKSVKA